MDRSDRIARSSLYIAAHSVALAYKMPVKKGPKMRWKVILSHLSTVWRVSIVVSNLMKLFVSPKRIAKSSLDWNNKDKITWVDYLLVNYLPQINHFSKLYYGVYCVCAGIPIVWRIYIDYILTKRLQKCKGSFSHQQELISFILNGPNERCKNSGHNCHFVVEADRVAAQFHKRNLEMLQESRRESLLSRAYRKDEYSNDIKVKSMCLVPINSADHLHDHSQDRLNSILRAVNIYLALTIIMKIPIYYFATIGLYEFTVTTADNIKWSFHLITIYGVIEFSYIFYSVLSMLTFVHIWIIAFYADARYKCMALLDELDELKWEYSYNERLDIPSEIISKLHLKLWEYFTYLKLLDKNVAPYGRFLTILLLMGLSFSHAVLNLKEKAVQMVIGSVLATIIMTYFTLHSISNDLEQQVSRIAVQGANSLNSTID